MNNDSEEKKHESVEQNKRQDISNVEAVVDDASIRKNVYRRVDVRRKLHLAVYCRDYEVEFNKTPQSKEQREIFPWLSSRQFLHGIKQKKT